MWLPGLRRARHNATVWVPARPEVVIRWLCDPDRRQQTLRADLGTWELVDDPTFEALISGGLRVRYRLRNSNWTTNFEIVDDDRTDRSFSRRIVMVSRQAGARQSGTMVARLRVDADEDRGGANLTAHAEAHLVGLARGLVLLGFHDIAYANAMVHQTQVICQQVFTVALEKFTTQ